MIRDRLGDQGSNRVHTDESIQVKYFDQPGKMLDKAAFTVTIDAGCEYGGGVSCRGGSAKKPGQAFIGFKVDKPGWFHKNFFSFPLRGGGFRDTGRYLPLIPPNN